MVFELKWWLKNLSIIFMLSSGLVFVFLCLMVVGGCDLLCGDVCGSIIGSVIDCAVLCKSLFSFSFAVVYRSVMGERFLWTDGI